MTENPYNDHPRIYEDNLYVYPVLSRRQGGVSLGININPDKSCNFSCAYCQVDRSVSRGQIPVDPERIRTELTELLDKFESDGTCSLDLFSKVDPSEKQIKDLALSGDGEPTTSRVFAEVCRAMAEVQEEYSLFDFSLVLITNATLLDREAVQKGLAYLTGKRGEIWAKLDAGSQDWHEKVNGPGTSLAKITQNIIATAQGHPLKIQSLICGPDGTLPDQTEIDAYINRLSEIKKAAPKTLEVQLYTLARRPADKDCIPAGKEMLKMIGERIRKESGLKVRVI